MYKYFSSFVHQLQKTNYKSIWVSGYNHSNSEMTDNTRKYEKASWVQIKTELLCDCTFSHTKTCATVITARQNTAFQAVQSGFKSLITFCPVIVSILYRTSSNKLILSKSKLKLQMMKLYEAIFVFKRPRKSHIFKCWPII